MDLSTAEAHERRVRVFALNEDSQQPSQPSPGDVLLAEGPSHVRRLVSTPAFALAWAASMPVAGGGLVWYAVERCFVC